MVRDILVRGDNVLREKCEEIYFDVDKALLQRITEDLKDTAKYWLDLHDFSKGIGISANQIGYIKRVCIVKFPDTDFITLINPEILEMSPEKDEQYEGCLSFFQYRGKVRRSLQIKLTYKTEKGNEVAKVYEKGMARLIQHEIDHLNGILYCDKEDTTDIIDYEDYLGTGKTEWEY